MFFKCTVFNKLALEHHIDHTVIDTAISRMQRKCNLNKSLLCLPVHTITGLNSGKRGFIRHCFEKVFQNFKPGLLLSFILVPLNMDNVHWGIMVVDVKNRSIF